MTKLQQAFLKALSAVLTNLAAAWFALAFITPNLSKLTVSEIIISLTKDVAFGIVFLLAAALIEYNHEPE